MEDHSDLVKCSFQASLFLAGGARACVVSVGSDRESIFFVSGYVQPIMGIGCGEVGSAMWGLGDTTLKCIGMDGNGHSPIWGPSLVITSPQGIFLENLLASGNLLVINAPNSPPTHMGNDSRFSCIDVTTVSVGLLE